MNTTPWRGRLFAALAGVTLAAPLAAQDLALPRGAERTFSTVQNPGTYALPTGPWTRESLPVERVEGRVEVAAWRVPGTTLTPFQMLRPLRDTLTEAGYGVRLDCASRACGGFDFRFATLVLPAPEMFVDLSAYHFVSLRHPEDGAVSLLASRDAQAGYVQIIRVGAAAQTAVTADAPSRPAGPASAPGGIVERLETDGHVLLPDLEFQTGSSSLGGDAVASLDAIAAYLAQNPSRVVLFVGHTDATGSLAANRQVSQARATAAVRYLRERHGTPPAQIGAEGAGYLAPMASNLTPEGRELNRRVEAVLLSTE